MVRFLCVLLAAVVLPSLAAARAPEPRKPVDLGRFMGRWYEILRTPNAAQKNCYAASQVWSPREAGRFSIAQVCHRDSVDGEEKSVQVSARIVDPATNAKFEARFFGGVIRQEYWILDRADDYRWMVAGTPGGNFVALFARRPTMPPEEVAAITARLAAMGLNTGKLVAMGPAMVDGPPRPRG
jgi:apolipoprotein D and lipocalin family protein